MYEGQSQLGLFKQEHGQWITGWDSSSTQHSLDHIYILHSVLAPPSTRQTSINQSELSRGPPKWFGLGHLTCEEMLEDRGWFSLEIRAAPGAPSSSPQCLWGADRELEPGSSPWGTAGGWGTQRAGTGCKKTFPQNDRWAAAEAPYLPEEPGVTPWLTLLWATC